MNVVIVSGLSGSGKTMALNTLEDQDFYCIDNLPLELLTSLFQTPSIQQRDNLAIGIDVRNSGQGLNQLPDDLKSIRKQGHEVTLVYLHAQEDILLKRYNETRRKHPLTSRKVTLKEALVLERQMLSEIRGAADLEVDTTYTSIYQLASLLRERVCHSDNQQLSVLFQSFGFKHGIPASTDFIFDVRCLPNPYWIREIRQFTGQDAKIAEWLEGHDSVHEMRQQLTDFIDRWIPGFIGNQRAYLTFSFGCTGGRHRSVYITERLAEFFSEKYPGEVSVFHRELSG